MMHRFQSQNLFTRRTIAAILGLLMFAFGCFTVQSSGNLYLETLRGISGPLDSMQYAALRLSHLLDITGVAILAGSVCTLLFSVLGSRRGRNQVGCGSA